MEEEAEELGATTEPSSPPAKPPST